MDIGKQQRVIMVELEKMEAPEPAEADESGAAEPHQEPVGEWPLPFDMYAEPVG